MAVRFEIVGRERFRAVGAIMASEADSRRLKLELGRNLRVAAEPVLAEQRTGVRSIPSGGSRGASIREAVASNLKISIRYTGISAGVSLRAMTTPGVRGFTQAPRRLNAKNGFRHPVFARGSDRTKWTWVHQYGKPYWFSAPPLRHLPMFNGAALAAIVAMELRLAARARAVR